MKNKANIYSAKDKKPSIIFSDNTRENLGICFSGGGSRALTCTWGQILGLTTLGVMQKSRYLSSVSGGTWAASVYTYLPDDISDEDLLGKYYPPGKLSLQSGSGLLNVTELGDYSLGKAPAGMDLKNIANTAVHFIAKYCLFPKKYKWLWASIIAEYVLEPYQLRKGNEKKLRKPWLSERYFTLSPKYAKEHFPIESPATNNFFYSRPLRPFLIMNDNIIEPTAASNVLFPNQVTPVSGGCLGKTPDGSIVGGGSVESYAFTSNLTSYHAQESQVTVKINKPYSLIDIVSTSSAFFAGALANYISEQHSELSKNRPFIDTTRKYLIDKHKQGEFNHLKKELSDDSEVFANMIVSILRKLKPEDFIPTYNYWPVSTASDNKERNFTDGGSLDNTGILGMLAQTDTGSPDVDPLYLLAFDNTSTALIKKDGKIIAGSQAAPLFGIHFEDDTGDARAFSSDERNSHNHHFNPKSLITVFDNNPTESSTPFEQLVNGLYITNCGDGYHENSSPAYHQMTLTTVDNPLANITGGRKVEVLYMQNVKILNWQNSLKDTSLQREIANGQKSNCNPLGEFENFPYYNTFFKIGLSPKESNSLSQMWAWSIADDASPLKPVLKKFIKSMG